jgi:hypothetical protein
MVAYRALALLMAAKRVTQTLMIVLGARIGSFTAGVLPVSPFCFVISRFVWLMHDCFWTARVYGR